MYMYIYIYMYMYMYTSPSFRFIPTRHTPMAGMMMHICVYKIYIYTHIQYRHMKTIYVYIHEI